MLDTIVTSAILELLIFPVIYVIWRRCELPDKTEEEAPLIPSALIPSYVSRQRPINWRRGNQRREDLSGD